MLTIHSNGSKWYGEAPDDVAVLVDVLAREPLNPVFEQYGAFAYPSERIADAWTFVGNFAIVSHVFHIDTDDAAVIALLRAAIAANVASPAYRAARAEYRHAEAVRIVDRRRADRARNLVARRRAEIAEAYRTASAQ